MSSVSTSSPSKKGALGAAIVLVAAMFGGSLGAQAAPPPTEMLVYDWNKPITVKERGFPRHFPPTNNSAWPGDFAQGTYYFRLELKTMPTAQDIHLQYCIWQDAFKLENCTYPLAFVGTPNTVATWTQSLPGIWKKNGVPIDYSRARQTDGFAIEDEFGKNISDYATWNWRGHNPADWYPMVAHLIVVVVRPGATFGGWANYTTQTIALDTKTYEAEVATRGSAVVGSLGVGYSGTGYVDYANKIGGFVEWNVTSPTYAEGKFTIRYANGSTKAQPIKVLVNNKLAVKFTCPPTGSWNTYQEVTFIKTLTRGANVVRATATASVGGPNIDYIKLETEAAQPAS